MVLEFDRFDLNQSKMSYFRVRNKYVPTTHTTILNKNNKY